MEKIILNHLNPYIYNGINYEEEIEKYRNKPTCNKCGSVDKFYDTVLSKDICKNCKTEWYDSNQGKG